MSVYKKFVGQTMVYGVSTILSRLLGFILTPFFTATYKASVYSILVGLYSWASILNAILAFGMETTFFRFLNKREDRQQEVYNNCFFAVGFLAAILLVLGLAFNTQIAEYTRVNAQVPLADQKHYVQSFVWFLFADAICIIPFAKLRAEGKAVRYSLIKGFNIVTYVLLCLFFMYAAPVLADKSGALGHWVRGWYHGKDIGHIFYANLISSIMTVVFLLPQIRKVRFKLDGPLFTEMLGYSWPILVANLSFIINENLDKIMLGKLLPANEASTAVGIYGAVAKIAIFLSIFNQAFRLGAEPFFFSHAKNPNSKQTYATIMLYFVIAVSIIYIGITVNIDVLKYWIGRGKNNTYYQGLYVVPYLLLGYVALGIYMNLSVWYRLSDQTRYGLYISMAGAAITIAGNMLLIPAYSYAASAWISAATYVVMMIISYLLGQKHYPIPYDLPRILAYLAVATGIVFISFFVLKHNIWLGNGLLLLFIGWVWLREGAGLKKMLK